MLVSKLIEKLQELELKHEAVKDMMGPATVAIDLFQKIGDSGTFKYVGVNDLDDIVIDVTSDGVYNVLCAFDACYQNPVSLMD